MTVASRRAKRAHGGSDRALHVAPVADRLGLDGRTDDHAERS
ncbi:hypothetical protein [Microbacterium oxydans]|nr:hypothetical protein [Microbacterium oxydans]